MCAGVMRLYAIAQQTADMEDAWADAPWEDYDLEEDDDGRER